ncbi:MAG: DUF4411 family protein, partial [Candidatus Delongbacteria bacterium]|nr:DUF4411 family protein [Candidatus Delongbacteria bacterium]
MRFDHIVIDASSLINFFKYYHSFYLINKSDKIIFEGLFEFLIEKIKNREIIILDKVFDELKYFKYNQFKKAIKEYVIKTLSIFDKVQELTDKYYIKGNEKFLNDNKVTISEEIDKFENKYADMYLIAYATQLKEQGNDILIISEETFSKDNKLFPK